MASSCSFGVCFWKGRHDAQVRNENTEEHLRHGGKEQGSCCGYGAIRESWEIPGDEINIWPVNGQHDSVTTPYSGICPRLVM